MSEVRSEREEPPQEPAVVNNPVQAPTQEKELDEKQAEAKHEAKQDRGGQQPAGIELSPLTRQRHIAAMNQWPQQTTPAFPVNATNHRIPFQHQPPPQPNPQGQGTKGVGGWLKSWADM